GPGPRLPAPRCPAGWPAARGRARPLSACLRALGRGDRVRLRRPRDVCLVVRPHARPVCLVRVARRDRPASGVSGLGRRVRTAGAAIRYTRPVLLPLRLALALLAARRVWYLAARPQYRPVRLDPHPPRARLPCGFGLAHACGG